MKQKLLKPLAGVTLAFVLALTFTHRLVSAQEDQHETQLETSSHHASAQSRRLEGVWEAQVTQRNCLTGDALRSFRGMTTFLREGASISTNNTPNPPLALGRWKYLGGRRYQDVGRFFRYNPDGSFAGVQRITRNLELNQAGNQMTGTVSIEIFDASDHLIQTGCATEITRRVE
jgi:hypothetical protein